MRTRVVLDDRNDARGVHCTERLHVGASLAKVPPVEVRLRRTEEVHPSLVVFNQILKSEMPLVVCVSPEVLVVRISIVGAENLLSSKLRQRILHDSRELQNVLHDDPAVEVVVRDGVRMFLLIPEDVVGDV